MYRTKMYKMGKADAKKFQPGERTDEERKDFRKKWSEPEYREGYIDGWLEGAKKRERVSK